MKKLQTILVMTTLTVPAFGQQDLGDLAKAGGKIIGAAYSGDQAKRERSKISKMAEAFNANQPNISLRGQYVVLRAPRGWQSWSKEQIRWFVSSMEAALTAIGAIPVWDNPEILKRANEIRELRGDDEVDQGTVPPKGSIPAGAFIIETELVQFDKSQQFGAFLGSFWRGGADFEISRETAYHGSILTLRRQGGAALAVYKTLASASTADNVSGNLVEGFFGNSVGFSSSENSRDALRFRAMENNIKEMTSVIKLKCK